MGVRPGAGLGVLDFQSSKWYKVLAKRVEPGLQDHAISKAEQITSALENGNEGSVSGATQRRCGAISGRALSRL
jgi:hypothetical protein